MLHYPSKSNFDELFISIIKIKTNRLVQVIAMRDDPAKSAYLFWKLSILINTLDKMREILSKKEIGEELDIDEKAFFDNAKLILKSSEVSLQSIKEVIDSLSSMSAKNYFYTLYQRARSKLVQVKEYLTEK